MASWVELRVHGVSGTPPESMLGSAKVVQVAGDERSRVFRQTDTQGNEIHPSADHLLEAFHWGRWTSGSWAQALWILLIPFGMVNAAQFMLPEPTNNPARVFHTISGAFLRLLALVLTGLITVGGAVVVMDLVTWQWLARRKIPIPDPWLLTGALVATALLVVAISVIGQTYRGPRFRFAGSHLRPPTPNQAIPGLEAAEFFDGDPDNPALRAMHRAASLLLLGWLGLAIADAADVAWAGTAARWSLGVLLVTVVVVFLLGDPEGTTSQFTVRAWHGWAPQDEMRPEGHLARGLHYVRRYGLSWLTGWVLLVSAIVSLVLAVVGFFQAHPDYQPGERRFGLVGVETRMPAMDETAAATGIAGTLAVGFLLLAVALLAWATASSNTPELGGVSLDRFRRFGWGMTPALASAVGFFIGIGLTAGLTLTVQGLLNRLRDDTAERVEPLVTQAVRNALAMVNGPLAGLVPPGDVEEFVAGVWPDPVPPVEAPAVLQRVSYAWGITLLIIIALAAVAWGWMRWNRRTFRDRATSMMTFGDYSAPRLRESWLFRVGAAMQQARLKRRGWLVSAFWVFAAAGLVLSLAATFGYAMTSDWIKQHLPWLVDLAGFRWWPLLTGVTTAPGEPVTWPDLVSGAGQLTLLGLAGGAVLITRGAIKAEGSRRALNVVWDVIAFWPRVVHPFVPPPYSQSVVPALVRRICWHLGIADPLRDEMDDQFPPMSLNPDPVKTVVLAAHSQGSLIALAALLWLPPEVRHRVRWLTFGSQLRQQFPRAFPHYVTVSMLRDAQQTHGWLSLYRDTDHIAGPVTSWGHAWEPPYTSYRLEAPAGPVPDVVDPRTGRRECGREWRLLDPVPADRAQQRRPVAALQKHSNYWLDPDWDDALAEVRAWVPPLPVSPGPGAPPAGP